ncbi:MAG: putative hydro-lyase [Gemmataceae bacterium]
MNAHDVRLMCRAGTYTNPTPGLAPGFVQANLVCVPREIAFDFLLFCRRNPRPCPLLDVTDPGDPVPRLAAPEGDVRTDCPRYRVYRYGELIAEPLDLLAYWRDDLVSFLLGCSFTFEAALLQAQLPVRHLQQKCNVPMYRTGVPCSPAGVFHGPLVVSMRPMTPTQAQQATAICAEYPLAHGAPIQIGEAEKLGIADLSRPDFGDPVAIHPGEVPVFWACGVTPQAVAIAARVPLLLTHAPGHMFLTDLTDAHMRG